MKPNFKIFNKNITSQSPALIIAEVGINHMGDVNLCEDMILSALDAGADCVKLQTVNVDESYHPSTESYKVFKGAELNIEEINFLVDVAEKNNGFLFSTPADFASLKLLNLTKMKAYKVSSGLLGNLPLISEISKTNIPIILSTGMANDRDIIKALNALKNYNKSGLALLHCVSLYPASKDMLNLSYINTIYKKYNIISGYSDHSDGPLACIAAISKGAKIIEKHFTINNNIKGADNAMSMDAKSFKSMCNDIRDVEKMIHGSKLKPHPMEKKIKKLRYRKIVAKHDIAIGEEINFNNINFMRININEESLDASKWHLLSGKKSKIFINKFSPVTLKHIV
tara:strand:- start:1814 stop:2833 length:1020 start_codon:yes stop_codon:yes gene_type:complete